MGAALKTRYVDGATWPLLRGYLALPVESLNACAAIFLGSCENDDDGVDKPQRLTDSYPRHLSSEQFEEIFGMLVHDAQPHFEFFCFGNSNHSVCAHHVFCSLVLLARGDLHAKMRFLLRLYAADAHGSLPADRRKMVLRDMVTSLPRTLGLGGAIENQVVNYLEKELLSVEDQTLSTCREVYEYCFTSARVSGYLHEIQSVVNELKALDEADKRQRIASRADPNLSMKKVNGSTTRLKLLNRGATMLQLTREALLWSTQAGDLPCFLSQDHLSMSADTVVFDALEAMRTNSTNIICVAGKDADIVGILTTEDFLTFLADLLPEDSWTSSSAGEFIHLQVATASRSFVKTTIRTVLMSVGCPRAPSSFGVSNSMYRSISADECLFNLILRITCGASAVAVFGRIDQSFTCPEPSSATRLLLGYVSALDILEWALQDVSILNGKESHAISSFPWLCHLPSTMSLCDSECGLRNLLYLDVVARLQSRKVQEVLIVTNDTQADYSQGIKVLRLVLNHNESVKEAFNHPCGDDIWGENVQQYSSSSLLVLLQDVLAEKPHMFEPCCIVNSNDSIAHIIHTMVSSRSSRVFVQTTPTRSVTSVVRATDILTLLLQQQHCKPRLV